MLSVETLVFSVDDVFSYKVVERRGISPPAGPTVRFPVDAESYFVAVERGFTGDVADAAKRFSVKTFNINIKNIFRANRSRSI